MNTVVIGAGRMGRRHIEVVKKLGLNLIGVVDLNNESLNVAKKECDIPRDLLFTDINKVLKNSTPDCAIISTTADSHANLTRKLAEKRVKYILVEKPLAVSLDQCIDMINTCEKYGCILSVNHQMRFMEQYIKPKTLLSSEEYGGFKSMTVVAGNFGMSMNGTHYFEAFRYLCDEDPYEVTAWFDNEIIPNPRGNQFEDRAGSIRVTTKSGKRLYLEISSDQGHGLEIIYAARNGIITVSELYGDLGGTVRKKEFRELPTTRYGMPATRKKIKIEAAEVIDSTALVLEALLKDQNRVTGEQGMMAVKVLAAAYKSAENGNKTIRLDEPLNTSRIFPWA